MIDAATALSLAGAAAENEGWGNIGIENYAAFFFQLDGQPAWAVRHKEIVVGHNFRFLIDARTGAVIEKECLGFR